VFVLSCCASTIMQETRAQHLHNDNGPQKGASPCPTSSWPQPSTMNYLTQSPSRQGPAPALHPHHSTPLGICTA
jgi:hypothetical protein